jgi:NADH:ubiquinone oxidoreductase subunit E
MSERARLREQIRAIVRRHGGGGDALLPVLQELMRLHGSVTDEAMQLVADELGIHPVEVYSVVSFYAFLDHRSSGRVVIRLCRTISCEMADKDAVAAQLRSELGIDFGQTTPDGQFTLEWASCLGMCDQGPALLVNDAVHTRVTPARVPEILAACRPSAPAPTAGAALQAQDTPARESQGGQA